MPAFPYMRFFVGDYLGDTRHLTTLEHGAYLLLIMAYWQRAKPLPNRDADLAHIAGVSRPQWLKMKPKIIEFFDVSDNEFVHHRIEQEIQHALDKSLKSQRAGRASVQRRISRRSTKPDAINQNHSLSDAAHLQDIPPYPQGGEPDLFTDELPPDGGEPPGSDEPEIAEKYPAHFETWWSEYPNKTGKRKAAAAYEAAVKRLAVGDIPNFLLTRIWAQRRVWKRKGVEGRFIPHPATWLNQGRYDDPAVMAEAMQARAVIPDGPEVEVVEAEPTKSTGRPKLQPVGWKPEE